MERLFYNYQALRPVAYGCASSTPIAMLPVREAFFLAEGGADWP
jgi:hypothetical protein